MKINELLDMPVWQLIGEELLFITQHGSMSTKAKEENSSSKDEKRYVYGVVDIVHLQQ